MATSNVPAKQIKEGDEIELKSGLVGVVFSAEPDSDGVIRIFIENKSGGMQSDTYRPDEPVKKRS